MTFTELILALACLMSATLVPQEANVKQLMRKRNHANTWSRLL
jgi:hypothetical protein